MARSLNKVQLIGNLTQDPEVRQTPNGQNVCSVSLATNRSWTDGSGQKQEKAEFHNIVLWGKLAEITGQYLRKGAKVYIEGRLETRNWEAQDGTRRYKTEVVAESMIMLDSKGASNSGGDTNFLDEYAKTQHAPTPARKSASAQEEVVTLEADPSLGSSGQAPSLGSSGQAPSSPEPSKDDQINIEEIPF
ncbi:MAG: single-stranded DNA-binding protein [Candidatus Gracilibacteria bacterium]|nr:single-stranded DNA-binding protein [Candidatus Gracilibacteria bacterium]